MKIIFDLDLTLIDSKIAEPFRPSDWKKVYSLIPSFKEYEGIKETLQYLKTNAIPYCIVTSSPSPYCLKVCAHWNICTDYTVCYHDVPYGKKKPDPASIILALSKMAVQASDVLSFGDKDIDIIASNSAKVKSVACLWGAENKNQLLAAKPKYIINTPFEIIPLLEKLK